MKKTSIPVSDSLALPALCWSSQQEQTKGSIVFLHGFTNHAGNYMYLGEWFSQQGYDFIAYDHRDHGASPLRNLPCTLEDMVDDARQVIEFVSSENNGLGVWLMGSSMGGALSILAAEDDKVQKLLSGLILWAPQVVSTRRRALAYTLLNVLVKVIPDLKLSTQAITVSNLPRQCNNAELVKKITEDKLMLRNPSLSLIHRVLSMGDYAARAEFAEGSRLLMLFGGQDTLIFRHDIKTFVKRVAESQAQIDYRFYPDNRHMLWGELNREDIYKDILKWMHQEA